MADINLLSTNSQSRSFANTGASLVVKILGVALFLVLAYYGYLWLAISRTQKSLAEWSNKTAQAQADAVNRKDRAQLITRQAQLQNIDTLLKGHLYWSYLLPELARVTLRSSTYTTVTADATGVLTITVEAPSYSDLEKYLQVFNLPQYNQQFSDVKVMSITKSQEGATLRSQMRLQLKFNPEFIRNRIQ